jgi:hypothetical protein
MRWDFRLNFPRLAKLLSDKSISLHVLDIVRDTYKMSVEWYQNINSSAMKVRGTSMHNFDYFW